MVTEPSRTVAGARQASKQKLVAAAFALFDEYGYERTTVDDIAERAGVGRSTFFRAFRSKEEVIFPDHDDIMSAVETRLAAATSETFRIGIVEAARLVLQHYLAEGALAKTRYRLTSSVPALRSREIASVQQYQRLFREHIRRWLDDTPDADLKAELLAASAVSAHNFVLRRWLREQSDDAVAEFDAAMATVFASTADATANTGAQTSLVVFQTQRDLSEVVRELQAVLGVPPLST